MVRYTALCLLLVLAAPPAAAEAPPLAAVGVVKVNPDRPTGGCTGVLIRPDVVLTAAHCLVNTAGEVVGDVAGIVFRTGAYPGVPSRTGFGAAVVYHPLYTLNLEPETARLRFDLALLRLVAPIPAEAATPLGVGPGPEPGERLLLASYRGGQGDRARERRCEVFQGPRGIAALGCEVKGGESGSPVIRQGEGGLEVAAVLSSSSRIIQQPIALAPAVVPRVDQLFDLLGDLEAGG